MLASLLLTVLLLHLAAAASLSKPGCWETCGNVVVPYPFGIGMNCSASVAFTIICNETLNPPTPFFMVEIGFEEVAEISLATKTVTVMQSVSPLNCSRERKLLQLGRPVAGFSFSSIFNRLVVVGCQNAVSLLPSYGECNPICGSSPICNGINCCQNVIPPRQREIEFFYRNPEADANALSCGYVFMADQRWLLDGYGDYTSLHNFSSLSWLPELRAPLALEWEFEISDAMALQRAECVANEFPFFLVDGNNRSSMSTTVCSCKSGYEGNPYLGCNDVNECGNSSLNSCQIRTMCVNMEGSFYCQLRAQDRARGDDKGPEMRTVIIGVSCGLGSLVLVGGAIAFARAARRRKEANRKRKFFKQNGGILLLSYANASGDGAGKIRFFVSKELALATDFYDEDRVVGRGGQGTVYKGMLPADGRIVAVKKAKKMDESDVKGFVNEVVILSQINHRNVVKLLGCCLETEVPLLVYEFVPNGTLFQHIHDRGNEFPLSWKIRVRIATEVAAALAYLHYSSSVPIYHRDIKSSNILLDEKYHAKVSDFGISRSFDADKTHVTTRVMGTFGYMDPQYFRTNQFTDKSDVYSFGVVVAELLTGEKAVTAAAAATDEGGRSLVAQFLHSMEVDELVGILDPEVAREGAAEDVSAVARLAWRCLSLDRRRRPTMKEAAMELEAIQMGKVVSNLQACGEERDADDDSSSISETAAESSEFPFLSRSSS